tara:strand:- start:1 stop:333 length:333 start_codon:yes stop_codon:yes gene_type:complete
MSNKKKIEAFTHTLYTSLMSSSREQIKSNIKESTAYLKFIQEKMESNSKCTDDEIYKHTQCLLQTRICEHHLEMLYLISWNEEDFFYDDYHNEIYSSFCRNCESYGSCDC